MIFWRVKSLDEILATAERKSLTRTLGAFQLTMLGIGAIIGTGIFVLTAEAATKAGPAMMISFVIAATVCALAALCYAEMASMVPVRALPTPTAMPPWGNSSPGLSGGRWCWNMRLPPQPFRSDGRATCVRLIEEIFASTSPSGSAAARSIAPQAWSTCPPWASRFW
jgi:basic amino acid/polyamine antiporter, APA family